MKSAAFVVVLCIVFFSTASWSETKFFKIPTADKKPDQEQVTPPEAPAEPKTDPKSETKFFKVPPGEKKPDKEPATPQEEPPTPKADVDKEKPKKSRSAKPKPEVTRTSTDKKQKAGTKKSGPKKRRQNGDHILALQVGTFKDLKDAQDEAQRLKLHAVSTVIKRETVRGKGDWYRVYAGRFKTKRDALAYDQELKKEGVISWSWVKRIKLTREEIAQQSPRPKERAARSEQKQVEKKSTAPAKKPSEKSPPKKRTTQPAPEKVQKKESEPAKRVEKPAPKKIEKSEKKAPPAKKQPRKKPKSGLKSKPKSMPKSKPKDKPKDKDEKSIPGRFSAGIRISALFAISASDFRITSIEDGDTEHYEFENSKAMAGLTANWRFSDRWSLDAAIEKVIIANIDMQSLSMGAKMHFAKKGLYQPYLRASLIYGDLSWDEAPGDFDSTLGTDLGIGIDFVGWRLSAGVEAAYRYMTFDYNSPSDPDVTASDSQVDFSGFTLSGIVRYRF